MPIRNPLPPYAPLLDRQAAHVKSNRMPHDLHAPAQLKFGQDSVHPPQDWGDADTFETLREALEAAAGRVADHPWIRAGNRIIAPPDVDDLWKEAFRARSD